jgi:branched-chain amino acid transport system ATP-binding protein
MLKVERLQAGYDGVAALHDVSFEIESGEIVTIVGSNGAGKSTTLRTVSGLLRPSAGSIIFEGRRIDHLPADQVVGLGIAHVPEGRRLFQRLTVAENLQLGAYTRKSPGERAAALDRIHALFPVLKERSQQLAGTLSGGEQQMCAIGRGLMAQPRLLMLDEPSLGIAPRLVEQILTSLAELRAAGVTILLVEQNVVEALELADRGYVLQTGSVVLAGSGKELLESDLVRQAYLGM